jgi:hypothetical protein
MLSCLLRVMTSCRIFSYKENGGGEALQWGLERHGSFSRPQFAFVNGPLKTAGGETLASRHWKENGLG